MKPTVVAITNLYPLPWETTRASFNKQQFEHLSKFVNLKIFVLVPIWTWLKHFKSIDNSDEIYYAPYIYIPKLGSSLTPFFQYLTLRVKARWILGADVKAIYACWLYPDAVASARFASRFGIRCIGNAHGTDVNYHAGGKTKIKQLLAQRRVFKYIFCASEALKTKLVRIGFDSERVIANYNGVDTNIFYAKNSKTPAQQRKRLVFVGSLIKTKGIFELISAFTMLRDEINCELIIVGQGMHGDSLVKVCHQSRASKYIQLLGAIPLPKVAEEMRKSDLLILPSYREGLPNVILEAFATGTPVVATTVGGIPEVVTPETGVLTKAKSVDGLYKAMKEAAEKDWNIDSIVEYSRQFDWSVNVRTLLNKLIENQ